MKRLLVIVRDSPCGGIRAREALDAVLLFSAFSPELSVLFSGDGVWQLVPGQQPDGIGIKPVEATLGAFEAYEITQVFADATAIAERGLTGVPLLAGARPIDPPALRALITAHDRVVTL